MRELQRSYEFYLVVFDGDYSDPARHRAPSSVGTCLTFSGKQLYVVIYPRYHTRIARSSRSDSRKTAQRIK